MRKRKKVKDLLEERILLIICRITEELSPIFCLLKLLLLETTYGRFMIGRCGRHRVLS